MSTVFEKIRIARTNRGWTQAELADRLCVSESTVQKWEKSKNTPSMAVVKSYRKYLIILLKRLLTTKYAFQSI